MHACFCCVLNDMVSRMSLSSISEARRPFEFFHHAQRSQHAICSPRSPFQPQEISMMLLGCWVRGCTCPAASIAVAASLQVCILFIRQRHLRSLVHLLLVLLQDSRIHCYFGRSKSWLSDKLLQGLLVVFVEVAHRRNSPSSGCRPAFVPATGRASRSCSLISPRCRSTEGSSSGGR